MSHTCNVPRCTDHAKVRGVCQRHYWRISQQVRRGAMHMAQYLDAPYCVDRWTCACPDARRDDWECPTCHRPSFSAERIAALRA